MMNIPLVKLDEQYILGESVKRFEDGFARFCEATYCVGCSSGTSALHLSLLALGIGPGDEVITVPNTFIATTNAILYTGASIRFVDVEMDTALIDIDKIESAITDKTKAILVVNLYGQMPDMVRIRNLALKHNLFVIEDACQSHGASWRGKPPGFFSDVACYSFFPSKNLGCHGDGGAVTTNNHDVADRVRLLSNHGRQMKYIHEVVGYNYRLDTVQADVLNQKLPGLRASIESRRKIARFYDERLPNHIIEREGALHSYHLYVIVDGNRDGLISYLREKGVECGVHYPVPLHHQPAYASLNFGSYPVAEYLASHVISIPMYPSLSMDECGYVVDVINDAEVLIP